MGSWIITAFPISSTPFTWRNRWKTRFPAAVTLADLELEFPPAVTQAVDLLTHREGVDYFDYVRSLRTNPIAVKVKLADIAHNADQTRCIGSGLASDDLSRWRDKYRKAQEILLASPLKV